MKKIYTAIIISFLTVCAFAQPKFPALIEAELNDDYKTFSKLVKTEDLNQKTDAGLSVVCGLAYFSDKNFEKACKLLASKKVNLDEPIENNLSLLHLLSYSLSTEKIKTLLKYKPDVNRKLAGGQFTPIQLTQFSTYRFVTNQKIPEGTAAKALATRKLLEEAGSEPFKFVERNFGNIGNFYFCFVSIVSTIYPFITPKMLNSSDLFELKDEYGRKQAQFKYDLLSETFTNLGIENEINVYFEQKEFAKLIKSCVESKDSYFLIAQTGNSKVAPWQWVAVSGCDDFNYNDSSFLLIMNPDSNYGCVDYQIKDLTQLITIKYKECSPEQKKYLEEYIKKNS